MDIMHKIVEAMGLSTLSFEAWPCQFRINKYNFTPETVGSTGVQIHTDSSFLTILQDDENVGGLEVMNKSGEFVAVEPVPGSLVVNFGDIATVSNSVFSLFMNLLENDFIVFPLYENFKHMRFLKEIITFVKLTPFFSCF